MLKSVSAVLLLAVTTSAQVTLERLGSYDTGVFDESAAEIAAHHVGLQRLYVVNGDLNGVDVVDIADPTNPALLFQVDLSDLGGGVQSVAVSERLGTIAVAVAASDATDPGGVVLLDANGNIRNALFTGALPDMVSFAPDGTTLLVANEGEPNDDYTVDPEGSVSVIDLSAGAARATQDDVTTIGFGSLGKNAGGLRTFGPGATAAQDIEPEYITTLFGSPLAWVALQENNGLAIIDWTVPELVGVVSLGEKDHSLPDNALDVSDRDDAINIANWPVRGLYQPDAIAAFRAPGGPFVISANEGDSRDYDGFSEEIDVEDADLDPTAFPDAATLQLEENLGRLLVSTTGDTDGDGDLDELQAFGARSVSIWNAAGDLVWDSGSLLEDVTAALFPDNFNSTNDENGSFDSRSDAKGPEPEGVIVGEVFDRRVAFVGLERMGGIVLLDISNPTAPEFLDYVLDRDFGGDAEAGTAGDLGPEGLLFIRGVDSPIGEPLLVVTNEVSGNTAIYRVVEDV